MVRHVDAVVILPTYNEAENLKVLLPKLKQYGVDVLVVDDSPNPATAEVAKSLGATVLTRDVKGRTSALLDGIAATTHQKVITMDADLQHPPETVPMILEALDRSDVVIASRSIDGGGYEHFTLKRKLISRVAKLLAWPLAPKIKDRSSGFVAFRREVLDGTKMKLRGFSTLELGVLVMGKYNTVEEVPYVFKVRQDGTSKLTSKVMLEHLVQLAILYLYKFRILRFALVGASGAVIGLTCLYVLTSSIGLNYLGSYAIAFVISVTTNYILNSLWTFKQRKGLVGWAKYALACSPAFAVSMTLMFVLTGLGGLWYILSAVILIFVAFLVNYGLSRRFVWAKQH